MNTISSRRAFQLKRPPARQPFRTLVSLILILMSCACVPIEAAAVPAQQEVTPTPESTPTAAITPLPTREPFEPGQLVDYTAQTGDTLLALAAHFNTTEQEIRQANPIIPEVVTTLPPGLPMKVPIYYLPLWGSPFQIIPDELFINGPVQVGFPTEEFVQAQPGWLNGYGEYASGANRSAAQIIDLVATNYSVSPRLLLALLEYQTGALTQPDPPEEIAPYYLGVRDYAHKGLYLQLIWAANTLNNAYYAWRQGTLSSLEFLDGRLERPDPWQNAATVALHYYYSRLMPYEAFVYATSGEGLAKAYQNLFGPLWESSQPHLPGSLVQPPMNLPFGPGEVWALTGGPHTGWGEGDPLAAIDFAPPSVVGGCAETPELATAVAAGVIARSEHALAILDLDGDGDERTGWAILYLHLAEKNRIAAGTQVAIGDPIGHPSCEGGQATGTHVHIARKYNGEWMPADSVLPFNMEDWIAHNGASPYQGTLVRFNDIVVACECSARTSFIESRAQ
jgi:murein DD-endopeptidase MepM/ murein hydrolase activator NlpD